MTVARQALAIARLQTGQGAVEERVRVVAWDRLNGLLSTLDSQTSVLLRFNAMAVAGGIGFAIIVGIGTLH
jgi:hypothetical protein